MNQASGWEAIRHIVRVCGRVVDVQGRPLRGVAVTLWSAPEPDERALSGASGDGKAGGAVCALLDRTESRPDGIYYFLDCAAGSFTATAVTAGPRAFGVASLRLPAYAPGEAKMAVADITVTPAPD